MKPQNKLPPWLRPRGLPLGTHVGVAWYDERNWERVKGSSTDPELFEATFDEWVAMAEKTLGNLLAAGVVAEKVLVDAGDLLAWCLAKGLTNGRAARAKFVSQQLQRKSASRPR